MKLSNISIILSIVVIGHAAYGDTTIPLDQPSAKRLQEYYSASILFPENSKSIDGKYKYSKATKSWRTKGQWLEDVNLGLTVDELREGITNPSFCFLEGNIYPLNKISFEDQQAVFDYLSAVARGELVTDKMTKNEALAEIRLALARGYNRIYEGLEINLSGLDLSGVSIVTISGDSVSKGPNFDWTGANLTNALIYGKVDVSGLSIEQLQSLKSIAGFVGTNCDLSGWDMKNVNNAGDISTCTGVTVEMLNNMGSTSGVILPPMDLTGLVLKNEIYDLDTTRCTGLTAEMLINARYNPYTQPTIKINSADYAKFTEEEKASIAGKFYRMNKAKIVDENGNVLLTEKSWL